MKSKTAAVTKPLQISAYYETLYAAWGPQHWWPAESQFEVIIGAILTQNTAWTNVEKALANLRAAGILSLTGVTDTSVERLEEMLRPAGYFRQKTARLKDFAAWIQRRFGGSLEKMFETETLQLREELLAQKGIGPETADSILLYAGQHEIFVVDAYTRRIFERHRLANSRKSYDEIRRMVETALQQPSQHTAPKPRFATSESVEPGPSPAEEVVIPVVHSPSAMSEARRSTPAQRYSEFHALLVQVAKHYCQSRIAHCDSCPLKSFLASGRPAMPGRSASRKRT